MMDALATLANWTWLSCLESDAFISLRTLLLLIQARPTLPLNSLPVASPLWV